MTESASPNAFESDKPGTAARSDVETAIETLRHRGGAFVEAVRATRMAMALTDPNLPGNPIVFANESFMRLSGYTLDEALGQQPFFMNGPDTDPDDAADLRRALDEDRDGNLETIQYRKDGSRFVANMLLSAFKDEAGQTLYHFLSWQDVTRRTDAEAEVATLQEAQARLRESEERYRTLFEAIDEGFCVIEVIFDRHNVAVDYRVLEVNSAFERQTGLADAVGRTMRELAPEHESHWFDTYGRIALTGEPARFEDEAAALGRWYDVFAFRVGAPEQRRVAVLFRDMTQRRLGEQALRDSEARYQALFAASPVPFMVLAPNAPDFTITAANDAYFAVTQTTRESLFGRRLFDVFPDDPSRPGQLGSEALAMSLDHVLTTRTTDAMERVRYDLVVPGGFEPHWWEAINAPMLDGSGEVTAIIHQVTRVTELHYRELAELDEQERQAFLLKLSDALRAEPSAEAIVDRALRMLFEQMRLDRCYVGIYSLAEDIADFPQQVHGDSLPPLPAQVRLSDFPEALRVAYHRTLVVDDVLEMESLSDNDRASFSALSLRAAIAATLRKGENNPLWAIVAASSCARAWTQSEVSLVEQVAERTWAAVERARAEAALRESEQRYRRVFFSNMTPMAVWTKSGTVVEANDALLELLGYDRAELEAGKLRWDEITPAEYRELDVQAIAEVEAKGFCTPYEKLFYHKDGRPISIIIGGGRLDETAGTGVFFAFDLTERKRAEQELASRELQFETLLDQAPLGVYLVDGDFVIRQVNPVAMPVFGDIPGGPIGRDFDEVIHILWEKDYADEVVSIFRHTLDTGEPYLTAERAEQRSDRDIIEYYEWQLDRIILPDGRHGVVCYFRDISAQVQARKEIEKARDFARDSEERYRLIVENARDYAIIITDPQDIITEWLPGAAAVFGWTREEAVGRPAGITFTPEDQAERVPEREIETAARDGEAPDVRWHQRKDGSQVFIEGMTSPLYNQDGSIRGFLKIGQDVSERRSAQEALEASERRMRTLVTGIPQMVFRSHGTGERIWGSRQWIEYTGLSFEESVGYGWLDGMHPEDREGTMSAWSGVEERGEYYCEHRILHAATRDYRWHQTRATPLRDKGGSVIEWLGTSTDVGELRSLQQRQGLLLAELQHRVRNIIALLRSVAGRTAETAETVEDYWQHLEGRISTMARTQGLLTRGIGSGVDLQNLVLDELNAQAAQPDRFSVTGPDVVLSGKSAEVLSLAIHELATNSVKYGALSADDGRIDIRWASLEDEDRPRLSLIWSEFGVQMNEAPSRQGFGMELITERVPYELQGTGTMDFRDCGLVATIEFPLLETPSILQTDAQVKGTVA